MFNHGAQASLVVLVVVGIFCFNNWFLRQFDAPGVTHPTPEQESNTPEEVFTGIRDFVNEYFSVYATGGSRSYAERQKIYEDLVKAGEPKS